MDTVQLPTLDLDPFGDQVLSDPTAFWRELRAAGPVVRLQQSEGFDIVGVGRHADVRAIFADHGEFLNGRGGGILDLRVDEPFRTPGALQETDPPEHDGVRKVMTAIISPRNLRAMRATFLAAAEQMVDRFLAAGGGDIQTRLAQAYPLQVIPDSIMGVRPGGRENLLRYSSFVFESMGPRTPRARAALEAIEDLEQAVAWVDEGVQRANVRAPSLGHQVWEAVDRGELTDAEAPLLVRSLVGAGVDTTIYALGIAFQALASRPAQWAALRENPALGKFAFEEALRWGAPVRQIWRTPARDLHFAGVPLREGQKVMLVLGAANRDPDAWGPTADEYRITRDATGHVALGTGIHACVGGPIARLEADVLLSTFARRVKTLEPTGEPVPLLNNTLRGWASVPVAVTPA